MLIEDFSATTVHVKLMDHDGGRFDKDDIIGTVSLPVTAAPIFKTTVALPARKGKHAGTPPGSVCVTVIFRPVTVDAAIFVLNGVPPKARGAGVRDVATQGLAMASGFMSRFNPLASRTPSAKRSVASGSKVRSCWLRPVFPRSVCPMLPNRLTHEYAGPCAPVGGLGAGSGRAGSG